MSFNVAHCAFHLSIVSCALWCRLSAPRWALCCYLSISRCAMCCRLSISRYAVICLSREALCFLSVYLLVTCAVICLSHAVQCTLCCRLALLHCALCYHLSLFHCVLCCHLSISRCALCSIGVLCLSSLITWCDVYVFSNFIAYCSIFVISKPILMFTSVPQIPAVLQLVFLTSLSSFHVKHQVTKIQTEVPFCNKAKGTRVSHKSAEHLPEYHLLF